MYSSLLGFQVGCFLTVFLVTSGSSEEVKACIAKVESYIQHCHRFSISCDPDSYIRFKSMHYHWSDCLKTFSCARADECCDRHKSFCHSDFTMEDIYGMFEICGGQSTCVGTAWHASGRGQPVECPGRSEKEHIGVPVFLSMEYDCVKVSNIFNLCEESSKTVNKLDESVHFMYKRGFNFPSKRQPSQCSCSISVDDSRTPRRAPTLAYQDIRLHREWDSNRNNSLCSTVHLSVSTSSKMEERHCTSIDPVSSFYVREPEPVDADLEIMIDSLFGDGPLDEPEMIWLSLEAFSPVKVVCGSKYIPQRLPNTGGLKDDDGDDSEIVTIVVPVICVTIAVISLVTVFYVLRKRRRQGNRSLSRQSSSKQSTSREPYIEDVYDTINDISRQGSKCSKYGSGTQGYSDAYSISTVPNTDIRQLSSYNQITATDDDYNRINLRTHNVNRDPDYNRLHSDTDSGVDDTFGTLQININDDVHSDKLDINDGLSNLNDSNNSAIETSGNTNSDIVIDTEYIVAKTNTVLKRKDSYETPESKSSHTNNGNGQNLTSIEEQSFDLNFETSPDQKHCKRKDSYEIPSIQNGIDTKSKACESDYEAAVSVSTTNNTPSENTNCSLVQFADVEETKRNTSYTAQTEHVELPHKSKPTTDSDSDSD